MAKAILPLILLSIMAVSVSTGAVKPEEYWKSKLPNTPIPSALRELLVPGLLGNREDVYVGPGGVRVNTGRRKKATRVNVGNGFGYNYAATEKEIAGSRDITLFFQEEDLRAGKTIKLNFARTSESGSFLPRSVADSVPFSSQALSQVMRLYSVKPNTEQADAMRSTLLTCENPAAKGETRFCATSLESMIDLSTSYLKTEKVKVISTEVSGEDLKKQTYTIDLNGVEKLGSSRAVACHAKPYVYAVFYCHVADSTNVYVLSMRGQDGAQVKAVAVCHLNTSNWNPGHIAFQVLKVKPGSVPVCHILPQDHVVWAPIR